MTNTTIGPFAVETVTLDERTVVGLRDRLSPARMAEFFGRAIAAVAAELGRRGITPDGRGRSPRAGRAGRPSLRAPAGVVHRGWAARGPKALR